LVKRTGNTSSNLFNMSQRRVPAVVAHSRKMSMEIVKEKKSKSKMLTPPQMFLRAAQQGDAETCERMADKWITSTGALGNTALHWAAAAGHTDVVQILLKAGADVHMTNDLLDTPLHSAAWRGFSDCATLLLNAGASRDAVNKEKKTPPQLAEQRFSQDHPIIQVLPKFTKEELAEIGDDDDAVSSNQETQYVSSSEDSQCEELTSF
jgi:hypothetical protein